MFQDLYQLNGVIHESEHTLIHKALRKSDYTRVIVKTCKHMEDLHRIERAHYILQNKNLLGIANVLDYIVEGDTAYLILEDKNTVVLSAYLHDHPISEKAFVTIAKNAAYSLESIHQAGILHKDIKPSNMLIDPVTLAVFYTDFGISVFEKDLQSQDKTALQGTIDYISPEQTGFIQAEIDPRSDLYSLGVTLYSILCGRLPFHGTTPMEIIHAHIALTPDPPTEYASISEVVSDIILKLLKKSPSDRYQSAQSLGDDWAHCERALQEGDTIAPFVLGESDLLLNLTLTNKLYGKEKELSTLLQIFDRASIGKTELVILKGKPGSGKTLLAKALENYVLEKNGSVLHGSFHEMENSQPYYVLTEAIERYFVNLQKNKTDYLAMIEVLKKTLGGNGKVLQSIAPHLAGALGDQPALVPLGVAENQHRTEQMFSDLLRVLARPSAPLLIFMDNVQWGDALSLRLFLSALRDSSISHCLILWTLRVEDINQSITEPGKHATKEFIDLYKQYNAAWEEGNFTGQSIGVGDFSTMDVHAILSDIFGKTMHDAAALAEHIISLTHGSPTEISHYLRALYDQKLITYDHADSIWTWDLDEITAGSISLDMGDTWRRLLKSLSIELREFALFLAQIGVAFSKKQVGIACNFEIPDHEFYQMIKELVRHHLIIHQDTEGFYTFADKNIHKICYNYTNHEQMQLFNYSIGMNNYRYYSKSQELLAQHATSIADYLNAAGDIVDIEEELMILTRLNRLAGDQALQSSSAYRAIRFYQRALSLLGDTPFAEHYQLAYPLYLHMSDAYFYIGDLVKTQEIFDTLLGVVADQQDRFLLFSKRIEQASTLFDHISTIALGTQYLKDSGLLLTEGSDFATLSKLESDQYNKNLATNDIECFLAMSTIKDPMMLCNATILALLTASYYLANHPYGDFYIYRCINIAYQYGLYPHFEKVLELAAVRRADIGQPSRAEHVTKVCLLLADLHNEPKANVHLFYGMSISHWLNPFSTMLQTYRLCKSTALAEGNVYTASFCDSIAFDLHFYRGINLSLLSSSIETAVAYAAKVQYPLSTLLFSIFGQFLRCLQGKTRSPATLEDRHFNEKDFQEAAGESEYLLAYYDSYKLQAQCFHGYYEEALKTFDHLLAHVTAMGAVLPIVQNTFFASLALANLCLTKPEHKNEYTKRLQENQALLAQWATQNPANFEHKYLIVELLIHRIQGNMPKMIDLYNQARKIVTDGEFNADAILLEECMYDFWLSQGIPEYSNYHKNKVYRMALELGTTAKAYQYLGDSAMDLSFSDTTQTSTSQTGTTTSILPSIYQNESIEAQAVLSVIQDLAYDRNIGSISQRFLSNLIQNGGSNKGYLLVVKEDRLSLEAAFEADAGAGFIKSSSIPCFIEEVDPSLLPKAVITSVFSKGSSIAVHAAEGNYTFYIDDAYIRQHQPESILCVPIIAKDKVIGIVYLENTYLPGVFTPERTHLMHTIMAQFAVILQNTLYYNEISSYAETVEIRLKQHINQLNSLIAGIAHEINSPIGVCVTVLSRMNELLLTVNEQFSQSKLSKTNLANYLQETKQGLTIAIANITRTADLVQNFKKVSTDISTEIYEPLNLSATLKNIVEYIRPAIKNQVSNVIVEGPIKLTIHSCSGALSQVFTNLIMNSAIHAFEGMQKDACKITIRFDQIDDRVQITFSDNGKGMTQEQLENLFLPFYTTKRNQGGSGLGAHIIQSLVTQTLGGFVLCTSVVGKGTNYVINLPLSYQQSDQPIAPSSQTVSAR